MHMERLEAKKINGHTYYYYSKWEWVDGRCRRVWQKYLGKPENIAAAMSGENQMPDYAEVFEWGFSTALWKECQRAEIVSYIDEVISKREQGLSTGSYISIAAINRAMDAKSKRSMWEWFSGTSLLRIFPKASRAALSSQRFWDHMDKIKRKTVLEIWKNILTGVVQREKIDLSQISYDGTNFYTFIDTFNTRCTVAKRGKNKQGRGNLRQISYALFCCKDGELPLFFDVYDGNCHDAKQFPRILKKFNTFLKQLSDNNNPTPCVTIVFDKGNNSIDNFTLVDRLKLHYVGSVKPEEHKDLCKIPNNDSRFIRCKSPGLEEAKAFRVKKTVYGKERTLVVAYNQNLFNSQWLTIQNDITNALEKLESIRQKLKDRANGITKGGKIPTISSIEKQCKTILSRQYMKSVINFEVASTKDKIPQLTYTPDNKKIQDLCDTYLGKNIIITDRDDLTNDDIISAYRSQFVIENVFKESKDRNAGTWWPLHHWTDSKIYVHGFYCTLALLLRALIKRRLAKSKLPLSTKRIMVELSGIREVVNVFPGKAKKAPIRQTVLTRTSDLQSRILQILSLKPEKKRF